MTEKKKNFGMDDEIHFMFKNEPKKGVVKGVAKQKGSFVRNGVKATNKEEEAQFSVFDEVNGEEVNYVIDSRTAYSSIEELKQSVFPVKLTVKK